MAGGEGLCCGAGGSGVRLFFILTPAVIFGLLAYLIYPIFGVLVFCALIAIGYSATKARAERGEGKND